MFWQRCLFLAIWSVLLSAPAYAEIPTHLWSQSFGDPNIQGSFCVAADNAGSVLITGYFEGTVDFGGGPLTSAGGYDIFLAKFNAYGNHVWSRAYGDERAQECYGVVFDDLGNTYLTGPFYGTVDFGGGPLASVGNSDIFLAKLDSNGNHIWSQSFGDADRQRSYRIAIDSSRNVAIVGEFSGTVDFGGGPITSAGSWDVFVAEYDTNGSHLWSRGFGDSSFDLAFDVAFDPDRNVLLTGWVEGTVDFGGGPMVGAGGNDIFLVKYGPDGAHLWSQLFGDDAGQEGDGVTTDASGNVILTGSYTGDVDFGGGWLGNEGSMNVFLAKFTPAGTHLWSHGYGESPTSEGRRLSTDAAGNIILPGSFMDTIDFGGGPLAGGGGSDIFLAKFDPHGNHVWSRGFGGDEDQDGWCTAVDESGNVLLTGLFEGTVDFGGGSLTSSGSRDIYLAKFAMVPTGVAEVGDRHIPMLRVFPNPVTSWATITYSVRDPGPVTLYVYDITGRLLQGLVDEAGVIGDRSLVWDRWLQDGSPLAPGVYFVKLESQDGARSCRFTIH